MKRHSEKGMALVITLMMLAIATFSAFMVWRCFWYFLSSWQSAEYSPNYGGLIIWPARLLILLGFVLLLAQGASELIKRIAVMRGVMPDPHGTAPAHQVPVE